MSLKKLSLIIFLVLCVVYVLQGIYYYPQLPEKFASHFGPSGQPDAWSTKSSFIMIYFFVGGIIAIIFLIISFGMSKIPVSKFNLLNKDYWLSKERKQETFDFMFHYILWLASATLLLLLSIFYKSFQVKIGKASALTHTILIHGLFIGFTIIWCIGFYIKFRKSDNSQPGHLQ